MIYRQDTPLFEKMKYICGFFNGRGLMRIFQIYRIYYPKRKNKDPDDLLST